MRWLAALVLLSGCSVRAPERLESVFESAQVSLRSGELAQAQAQAEHGLQLAQNRGDKLAQWRFKLLRSEILIMSGRAEEVLARSAEQVPALPAPPALAARRKMLQGQAESILGHREAADALLCLQPVRSRGCPMVTRTCRATGMPPTTAARFSR